MGIGKTYSAVLHGLDVNMVEVEADLSNGLPMFHMVGYLAAEVKEAGERVRTAIKNSGLELPVKKTIINLSPGNLRKRGSGFDVPIALAILTAIGVLDCRQMETIMSAGELGLDGSIRQVAGVLPMVWEAKKQGFDICIVPWDNREEAMLVEGIRILAYRHLGELIQVLAGKRKREYVSRKARSEERTLHVGGPDFREVKGQGAVKRAAEIAVAGGHNLLMIGPPGSGKSMIASRISTILPPLTKEESLELTKIYSVQGLLPKEEPLIRLRPFREIHHTTTKAALIGGGAVPSPGEISLADKGVLFLDELAEFPKSVLEVLRQPLEDKRIRLTRKSGTYVFPADFILVAAMNPCPCGYYPDYEKCICTDSQIRQYLGKISQPLLSRIDICMDTPKMDYEALTAGGEEESSETIRKRVCMAREIQQQRYETEEFQTNAGIPAKEIKRYCHLQAKEETIIRQAFDRMGLTARTYHKTLKVARTIADLAGEERILESHLKEAIGYRMPDGKYWGNIR